MPRITWPDLPDTVRTRVEGVLGGEVVAHRSHPGGFSPGTADRVQTAEGRVAFVKAVHPDLNPDTPDLHRAELRVMRALPPSLPAPRLIDGFELDGWVVLVLEHVDGAHPALPWTPESFEPVLDATPRLSDRLTPSPLPDLAAASAEVAGQWNGFEILTAAPPADLDPWLRERLPELAHRARRSVAAVDGDTLSHYDLRSDNVLIDPAGGVVFIDWPYAMRAARWLDATTLLFEFASGQDDHAATDEFVRQVAGHVGVDTELIVDVLVALTGYMLERCRRPDPPGLPTLRAFQRTLAEGMTSWLRATTLP